MSILKNNIAKNNCNDNSLRNPFKLPDLGEMFAIRDDERRKKEENREKQKLLKVYEKIPPRNFISYREAAMINDTEIKSALKVDKKSIDDYSNFVLRATNERKMKNETYHDYIAQKREMFLLQYSIDVKRAEIRQLEEIAVAEERKLEVAEQCLEQDAAMFDEFLKENDRNSVEAIAHAEQEARKRMTMAAEVKRLNIQTLQIRADINKCEERLRDYKLYKDFIYRVIPEPHRSEILAKKAKAREERRQLKMQAIKSMQNLSISNNITGRDKIGVPNQQTRRLSIVSKRNQNDKECEAAGQERTGLATQAFSSFTTVENDTSSGDDTDTELYFTSPQQLLDIFTELEESNLSLIQNCQEAEESVEELKQIIKATEDRTEIETKVLTEQINKLKNAIGMEDGKTQDLEFKSKMFAFGNYNLEDQQKTLQELHDQIADVYRECVHKSETSISTIQMLTSIEARIEELFETLELLPANRVEAAQRVKEKERRLHAREEKKRLQRLHQEERIRRALERAKAAPKKQTGRRMVARSKPPKVRRSSSEAADRQSKDDEELAYYFT